MPKALVLFSGGLDSILAARLMQDQPNLEVEGIHFASIFTSNHSSESEELAARKTARQLNMPLCVEDNSEALLELVKRPKHGFGRNMNPCIDCRIRSVTRAFAVMKKVGADFLVTGEVVGERPMSQNRQSMRLIAKEAGVEGLLLRPLSAKLLEPTIPENEGWVERERLLGIHGRSRKPQMELAAKYGIDEYPSPAGGCLLTDPGFSARLRDLLEHNPACDPDDCRLLKVGRHFRLSPKMKIVVGRYHEENEIILSLAREGDRLMTVSSHPGPLTLVRGSSDEENLRLAGAVTARYGKAFSLPSASVRIRTHKQRREEGRLIEVQPAVDDVIAPLRIAPAHSKGMRDSRAS